MNITYYLPMAVGNTAIIKTEYLPDMSEIQLFGFLPDTGYEI